MYSYWDLTTVKCLSRKTNEIACVNSIECLNIQGLQCLNQFCQCATAPN